MASPTTTNAEERLQAMPDELANSRTDNSGNNKKRPQDSDLSQNLPFQVPGKEKRVRLTPGCAETVFKLCKALQHRCAGQTVEWLLNQAKAPVEAILDPQTTTNFQPPPPPAPSVLIVSSPPMPARVLLPPATNVVPGSNQPSSVPVVVDAGDDPRMALPIAGPEPMLASAGSSLNPAEDDDWDWEFSAETLERLLTSDPMA